MIPYLTFIVLVALVLVALWLVQLTHESMRRKLAMAHEKPVHPDNVPVVPAPTPTPSPTPTPTPTPTGG